MHSALLDRLRDPAMIFSWPCIASWFAILLFALVAGAGLTPRRALGAIFPRALWLSPQTRTDFVMSAIHVLTLDLPLESLEISAFGLVYTASHHRLARLLEPAWTFHLAVGVEAALAALVTVLAYDLATWVAHWLSHRVPFLWDLHSVHHSAATLTPFTIYRDHPLDHAIRNVLRGVFTGLALAGLHALLPRGTWGATILGVGAGFLLYRPVVHLHHSHIPIHYPRWLGWFFLSPHLHQLHHSSAPHHRDRNLGVIFPFWDRLFGTFVDERCEPGSLSFGLEGGNPFGQSLLRCYFHPFLLAVRRLRVLK